MDLPEELQALVFCQSDGITRCAPSRSCLRRSGTSEPPLEGAAGPDHLEPLSCGAGCSRTSGSKCFTRVSPGRRNGWCLYTATRSLSSVPVFVRLSSGQDCIRL